MNIIFDRLALLVVFICGAYFLLVGMRAKKAEEKRKAGILLIFMAVCLFVFFILGMLVHVLKPARPWARMVLVIQAIIAGALLGDFVVMLVSGQFKLLGKPRKTKR